MTCKAGVEGQLVHSRFPGYFDDDDSQQSPSIVTPDSNSWGLSVSQMKAMGITNESAVGRTALDPVSLPSCRLGFGRCKGLTGLPS